MLQLSQTLTVCDGEGEGGGWTLGGGSVWGVNQSINQMWDLSGPMKRGKEQRLHSEFRSPHCSGGPRSSQWKPTASFSPNSLNPNKVCLEAGRSWTLPIAPLGCASLRYGHLAAVVESSWSQVSPAWLWTPGSGDPTVARVAATACLPPSP